MNVVHVFPYSARVSGGHSNAIHAFIRSQRLKGINAVAISPRGDSASPAAAFEFPLVEVDSLWAQRWEGIARSFRIAAGDSLLNFHSVNRRFAPLLQDLRAAGVPHVLTSHGQLGVQTFARWFKKFVYLNFVDWGPRRAAGLHLLTSVVANQIKLVLPGYRGAKLIQGNLINPPEMAALPAMSPGDFGIPPAACRLLYLGRLDVPIKGLDLVVEALSYLPAGEFHLVMAGPDWQNGKARLKRLAAQFGCQNYVHFTGPVYGDRKWGLIRMADIFVSPSRREAFSVALAEAMALGLPVVTSVNTNIAPDLMADGTALACPLDAEALANAIMTLARDRDGRLTLGNNGRAWVEANCNPYRAGERFHEFYGAILARRRPAGGPPQPVPARA